MLVTPAGYARLEKELDQLQRERRRELADRLAYALDVDPDVVDNSDYLAAKEELAALEGRINRLEQQLLTARIVTREERDGLVELGSKVRLRDLDSGDNVELELVGQLETDAGASRISHVSPVGAAVLGRRKGDRVRVRAPKRVFRLEIVDVGQAAEDAA